MPTTTLVNPAAGFATLALQARTDAAGVAVDDVTGEDLRLVASMFSGGVVGADSFKVAQRGSGANMSVDVGSGSAESDLAVVPGTESGQGNYVVRLGDGVTNVPQDASDVSNPRIDEIYVVVQDNQYDSSSRVIARIGYREGDPGASPTAPGPDGAWTAYLLVGSILVGAGATTITDSVITDERAAAGSLLGADADSFEVDGLVYVSSAGVGSTDETKATVLLSIPPGWNSYRVVAQASMKLESSVASAHESILRLRVAGVSADAVYAYSAGTNEPVHPTVMLHRAGLTSTGSLGVLLRAVRSGSTNGNLNSIQMYARAVRTS